jgi:hypothetical protein
MVVKARMPLVAEVRVSVVPSEELDLVTMVEAGRLDQWGW